MTRILLAMLLTFLSLEVMGKSLRKQCIEVYGDKSYCDEKYEIDIFKDFGAEVVKGCRAVYNYWDVCLDTSYLALFKKYGEKVIRSCQNNYYGPLYTSVACSQDSILDIFKNNSEELINRCTHFHGNVFSKCNTNEAVAAFSEIAPYIEPCRSALGNGCTDCSSVEGVKRFMKGEIAKESIGPNYFNIAEFFDIAMEPTCSVYQLELRPKYEQYEKKTEDDLNNLIQCEVQHAQNNLMAQELQTISEKMISDLKYMSLYKASLKNDKLKDVFLDFVRNLAKENKLSDKAQISDTGISYADAEIEIGLSFKDTVDKENNKQSVLQIKSLQCEKKYPPHKKLSYEDFRNKKIPPSCLKFSLKKQIGPSSDLNKVKSKTKTNPKPRKSQATTF